jgi:hypothetical protein
MAWAINETNPAYVTREIVTRFKHRVRRLVPMGRPRRR